MGEFFKYLNFIPEFHTGDQGSLRVLESNFCHFTHSFLFLYFYKVTQVYMKTEYVLCLSISIEINAALEISKKDAMFSVRN